MATPLANLWLRAQSHQGSPESAINSIGPTSQDTCPVDDDQVSPSSTRYGKSGSGEVRQELGGTPHTNSEHRIHQAPRTLAVHNMLNPPEPYRLAPGVNANPPLSGRPPEAAVQTSTPGAFTTIRSFTAGQPASISLPGTPVGTLTPLGGPASECTSSTTTFPFPAMNNLRKKLSPNPPRAMTLSQSQASHGLDPRQHTPLPSMAPAKRSYEDEVTGEHRPDIPGNLPGIHHSLGIPLGPASGVPPPSRSLSLPVFQSPGHAPPSTLPPTTMPSPHLPQQIPTHSSISPAMPPLRSYPSAPPVSKGPTPWTDMIGRHGLGSGMVSCEAPQAYMTLPGSDTPIPVRVDYSQASKKADEKRQRNAVASTRHRRKKKIMLEESTKRLQELRDERRQMEMQIDNLTVQRDRYRGERNRLREIILQTPGISHLVSRQQSPGSARSSSFGERDPLLTAERSHMPSPQRQNPGQPTLHLTDLYMVHPIDDQIDRSGLVIDRYRSTGNSDRSIEIEIESINRIDQIDWSIDFEAWAAECYLLVKSPHNRHNRHRRRLRHPHSVG
ncbi:hypothetical protein B0T10DRAFT_552340 [Thelonectria olida]|uniref:BZIP domain-containing protein n=1 Tax=Thelonectria olida TaxID=1576542 RepID=A0A9P8VU54_9HYPO|nr:hypothetical protein B0T10DRAFT_552340 [Thelonectria olida]